MGLARQFGGKQPKSKIYIIREYELDADLEEQQQLEQLSEDKESQP